LPATSILQVCPPLLFPSAVRDGAPQTLTKLFVFGSASSYNILPTNFDFVCKNYRVYIYTPMSYAGSAPGCGCSLVFNNFGFKCSSPLLFSTKAGVHCFFRRR
jgi:hypothetical protein